MRESQEEQLLKGWESEEEAQATTHNMLRILQSKITNQIQRPLQKMQEKQKLTRPLTGRISRTPLGNYSSSRNNKQSVVVLTKKRHYNDEKQNSQGAQILSKTCYSLHLKDKKRSRTKCQQKPKIQAKDSISISKSGKTICVLDLQKKIPQNYPNTQRQVSGKQKMAEQFPLKKQSLIFNSYNAIKSKNSQKNDNCIANFHQMEIKLRRQKPKPDNYFKVEGITDPFNFRSLKEPKIINVKSSKQNTFKAYTRYTKLKRKNQIKNGNNKIEQQIFGDHHFSDDFCFRT